jgi:hypothetical protein
MTKPGVWIQPGRRNSPNHIVIPAGYCSGSGGPPTRIIPFAAHVEHVRSFLVSALFCSDFVEFEIFEC